MKKCPRCGSRDIAAILYGMPVFDDELRSKIDAGKLRLGGCCSGEPAPKYFCNGCGKGFAAPPIHIRGGRPEDYRKAVTAVRFSDGGFFGGMKKITIEKRGGKRVIAVFLPHAPDGELHQREFTDREWKSLLNKLFCDLYIHEWKKNAAFAPTSSTASNGSSVSGCPEEENLIISEAAISRRCGRN
jgi:hypothetical protein